MKHTCIVALMVMVFFKIATADSLFSDESEKRGSLVADNKRQFEIGDIVTVLVRETTQAQTRADTNTKKESDLEAKSPPESNRFLVDQHPGGLALIPEPQLPNWDISIENEHKGRGSTSRNNQLVMTIACVVTHVDERSGNITLEGTKRVTVNREDCWMRVRGMARTKDVTPANTLSSQQIANAEVELKGQGPLWNTQRRGILTRILDWFSPF